MRNLRDYSSFDGIALIGIWQHEFGVKGNIRMPAFLWEGTGSGRSSKGGILDYSKTFAQLRL